MPLNKETNQPNQVQFTGSHLLFKLICLKIIRIQWYRVNKKQLKKQQHE